MIAPRPKPPLSSEADDDAATGAERSSGCGGTLENPNSVLPEAVAMRSESEAGLSVVVRLVVVELSKVVVDVVVVVVVVVDDSKVVVRP